MPTNKKDWREANRERIKLHSARYRLKKKGLDPSTIVLETPEEKAARQAASRELSLEKKRIREARYREKTAERFRTKYRSDPEFRAKCAAKRKLYYEKTKKILSDEERADGKRRREEALARARKIRNAQQHAEALKRAAEMEAKKLEKRIVPPTIKPKRKPGRLLAICGWNGL